MELIWKCYENWYENENVEGFLSTSVNWRLKYAKQFL